MSADLLKDLSAAGVHLAVGNTGKLKVSGDPAALDRWLPDIRVRKNELLAVLRNGPFPLTPDQHANIQEAIAERAAIQEFDGGLSRSEAETQATRAMRVYRYRLTDKPADWLVMIAPGCDLEEARQTLIGRFGEARVIDVRESTP